MKELICRLRSRLNDYPKGNIILTDEEEEVKAMLLLRAADRLLIRIEKKLLKNNVELPKSELPMT